MSSYSRRGLHGQTVDTLARRILGGELAEGNILDIPALEAELDVSRPALREALKVLAAKGLVDARQKRGTFVRPRADWNLLDGDVLRWQFAGRTDESFLDHLDEVRSIVEPAAARLAALRRTDADVAALAGVLAEMRAADGDPAAAVRADLIFHRLLLAATHNELLERMEAVIETGLAARDRLVHDLDRRDDPVPSHRAVFDAVVAGDDAAAEQAMLHLLAKAREDVARLRQT